MSWPCIHTVHRMLRLACKVTSREVEQSRPLSIEDLACISSNATHAWGLSGWTVGQTWRGKGSGAVGQPERARAAHIHPLCARLRDRLSRRLPFLAILQGPSNTVRNAVSEHHSMHETSRVSLTNDIKAQARWRDTASSPDAPMVNAGEERTLEDRRRLCVDASASWNRRSASAAFCSASPSRRSRSLTKHHSCPQTPWCSQWDLHQSTTQKGPA